MMLALSIPNVKNGKNKHRLRHMHASLLLVGGVHLKIVSERLGHSNVAMTADTYSHLLPGLKESAALVLDQVLNVSAT